MELPNYTDLGKIYEMNPAAFWQAQDQMDLARQFQAEKFQQERARAKQLNLSNMFEEQNMPHKLRQSELTNLTTEAELGPKQTKSWIDSQTRDQQLQLQMKEMATKASKADLDGMEYAAQQMAYSPDPNVRAQGEQLLQMHKDFIKMREEGKIRAAADDKKFQRDIQLEGMRQAGARSLEQLRIDAGKYAKTRQARDFNGLVIHQLSKAKSARDQHAILTRAAAQAQFAGEPRLALEYQTQADALRAQAEAEIATTAPKPGEVDIGKAGVAVTPNRPIANPNAPVTQGPLSRQLYPNGTPRGEAPPAQIPPGAKQIGTSGGKPVYEINGKRFILE